MNAQPARVPVDTASYERQARQSRREGRCFICQIASGTHSYRHQMIYEDDTTIAFLDRYPTLLGYCLIAPREHAESWVHDLSQARFLDLQRIAYRVARADAAQAELARAIRNHL